MPRAMVLGAGFGERLRPLTHELPKPLLPFGDRPLLEHALLTLRDAGFGPEIVVNTHHLADAFERCKHTFSLGLRLVREPEIRGTAGGIAGARTLFEPGPVLVLIGDVVLESIPPGFEAAARRADMLLAVAPRTRGLGSIGMAADGHVVRLRGECFGEEVTGGDYVGLMALGEQALHELPERGCYIKDYALPRLRRGAQVSTYPYTGDFVLPGDDPRSYLAANLAWLERRAQGRSFVGAGAHVAPGVTLAQALVGSEARVDGNGILKRVMVLPGAHASAPLEDAIATRAHGILRL